MPLDRETLANALTAYRTGVYEYISADAVIKVLASAAETVLSVDVYHELRGSDVVLRMSSHDAFMFSHALAMRIKCVAREYELLRITRDRDLTRTERAQLPANISQSSREQLKEQIDSYHSLLMSYEFWAEKVEEHIEEANKRDRAERMARKAARDLGKG